MREEIVPDPSAARSRNRNRKKQSEVTIIGGMRSSSPAPPGLSSGSSSSPSITSVETSSTGVGFGFGGGTTGLRRDSVDVRSDGSGVSAPVITAMATPTGTPTTPAPAPLPSDRNGNGNGAMEQRSSRASSSSWSTAAPSAASAASAGVMENDAQSQDPSDRLYTCLFHMLDCHDSFDDFAQWKTHVLSHFRTHPPPRTARCPLCSDAEFVDEGDDESLLLSPLSIVESSIAGLGISDKSNERIPGQNHQDETMITTIPDNKEAIQQEESAWLRMLDHVATAHYQRGETLAGSRPDFELMRYLYGRRIITDAQFKAMQLAPAPSSPAYHRSQDRVRASIGSSDEPYYAPYSRRREERMRGATKGVSVV
ncbi:hypothetical protein N7478_008448 [Penicillium angulare]|uniref:uncharacterized protein n=1 Tax=Penicillium angulare TaxID=116970 RepID=UPI0025414C0E|nr:uncharacterized protein N7478_008448 [Penicillium angulare]KAJ5273323.1 hypothetical protein N7478_008448 [Penicillium angulare]